jgi:hypothetical protein
MKESANDTKTNISFEEKPTNVDVKKNIFFWVLSCTSWLLLIIAGWISIKWLDDEDYYVIWTIYVERNFEKY